MEITKIHYDFITTSVVQYIYMPSYIYNLTIVACDVKQQIDNIRQVCVNDNCTK